MSYTIKIARQIYSVHPDEALGEYIQTYDTCDEDNKNEVVADLWDYLKDNGMFRKEIEERQ